MGILSRKFNVFAALLIGAGALSALSGAALAAEIIAIRLGETSVSETRIVFDSNGLLTYELTASGEGPGRLDIAFDGATLSPKLPRQGRGAGHIAGYSSTATAGGATVTLALGKGARIKELLTIAPSAANSRHRLVIDLLDAQPGALAASLPPRKFESIAEVIEAVSPTQASSLDPVAAPRPPTLAPLARRPVIVIDAGHGGADPGAEGPSGSTESAATLAAALELSDALTQTGKYEVVLTRSADVRIAHEERSRFARDAKADLFISLHADAHADAKVRGGSVYTLSDEGTERSVREALATGNYVVHDYNVGEDPSLGRTLYKVAQSRTENESDIFAELLIGKLAGVTPLLNNTHRRGNFKVLLAPDVPAVLLELAFISNKQDETNLKSPTWRKRTMGAVVTAIDTYFEKRSAVAPQARSGAAASLP
ncbi:MAG: N-acetylmuramoyl-L-alanine amidase [Parvularculaceae bacterium]|nr:N-acetylmuramoyl-L-alanine amidase [Parvularculaceae bacterium]